MAQQDGTITMKMDLPTPAQPSPATIGSISNALYALNKFRWRASPKNFTEIFGDVDGIDDHLWRMYENVNHDPLRFWMALDLYQMARFNAYLYTLIMEEL